MRLLTYTVLICTLLTIFSSGCANKVSLTGGPKDEIPPQLDTLKSTPNFQLRFEPKEIVLAFDEFINFRDPSKNIVISPPLEYTLDISQRGKEIKINFDEREKLKEEATYIINFGESIADFTENNILKNFSFVYSTGDYIDSLSIGGKVINAFSKEPVDDITVMLYDDLSDSVVYKERPFYFAKTEEDGSFKLNNLRGDTFKIVAMRDLNLNYTYDKSSEEFAFLDEYILVEDTSQQDIELYAFSAESSPRFLESEMVHDGLFSLKFDKELEENPASIITSVPCYFEIERTNVKAYVKDIEIFPVVFEIRMDSIRDTISIRRPQNKDRKDLPKLKLVKSNISGEVGLHPQDTLRIEFSLPLDSLNRELMNMDASEIMIDSNNLKSIIVLNKWEEGEDYILKFDSNAIVDFYGRALDSTGYDFEVARKNAFGKYDISLKNKKPEDHYLLQLLDKDKKMIHSKYVEGLDTAFSIGPLVPGVYSLDVIFDENGNKKWDTGDYDRKKQPEKLKNVIMDPIESNRTATFEVDFRSVFSKIDTTTVDSLKQR